jgi:hypothetical protein
MRYERSAAGGSIDSSARFLPLPVPSGYSSILELFPPFGVLNQPPYAFQESPRLSANRLVDEKKTGLDILGSVENRHGRHSQLIDNSRVRIIWLEPVRITHNQPATFQVLVRSKPGDSLRL